jgi:hypothetical protein
MRTLIVIVVSALGTVAAAAADLPVAYPPAYSAYGVPAAPLVIYDYEPGTVLRAYWLPPWRNRHYFPMAREVPHKERISVRPPRPAEPFSRYWSTPPLPPPPGATVIVPVPDDGPLPQPLK